MKVRRNSGSSCGDFCLGSRLLVCARGFLACVCLGNVRFGAHRRALSCFTHRDGNKIKIARRRWQGGITQQKTGLNSQLKDGSQQDKDRLISDSSFFFSKRDDYLKPGWIMPRFHNSSLGVILEMQGNSVRPKRFLLSCPFAPVPCVIVSRTRIERKGWAPTES